MKKHGLSKFIALAMAGTLLVSPLTAFGAPTEETTPGSKVETSVSGNVVGVVNKTVYRVALPTVADGQSVLGFKLDPQGLIAETDASKIGTAQNLYFTAAADSKFQGTSDTLTITNKSSVDVDVSVEAKVSGLTGGSGASAYAIGLANSPTFAADDTSTSIYLALNVDSDAPVALDETNGASVTKTVSGNEANYEVTGDADNGFAYQLKSGLGDSDFETLTFSLSGACNNNADADWANAAAAVPQVDLVWGFDEVGGANAGPITFDVTPSGKFTLVGFTDELVLKQFSAVVKASDGTETPFAFNNANGSWSNKTEDGVVTETYYQCTTSITNWMKGQDIVMTVELTNGETYTSTITNFGN